MTHDEILKELASEKYGFLKTDERLKGKTVLLGLGGSHAYGTSAEGSDIDLRGCALNSREEILTGGDFDQYNDSGTDTVMYSFRKMLAMLAECRPNAVEMLGLKPEHYIVLTDTGKELLANRDMFLSKRVIGSFGEYAHSHLRRLENRAARQADAEKREEHILRSIENAEHAFREKYFTYDPGAVRLYIDRSERKNLETEIFMDISLKHYPLRDYANMWNEMNGIVRSYADIGKRNRHAAEHGKTGKQMMYMVRMLYMCLDILEKGEIVTFREKEHDLLMDIRNGKYLDEEDRPVPEFYEMVADLEEKLEYAKKNTCLPDVPDYGRIREFMMDVNDRVVRGFL